MLHKCQEDSSRPTQCIDRRDILKRIPVLSLPLVGGCLENDNETRFTIAEETLVDEEVEIQLDELDPTETVTVSAIAQSQDGTDWEASGTFEADEDGTLSVPDQPPLEGTYENADPMGLFWSMLPENASPGDELSPGVQFIPGEDAYDVELTAELDGDLLTERTITRRMFDQEIEQEKLEHDKLVGEFFVPPGDEPVPGVMHLHGAGGEIHRSIGRLLASHGFGALLVQYFGEPNLIPDELVEVPLEYFESAMNWVRDHDRVIQSDIGIVGFSRGGELALLLGSRYSQIGCIVGWVPSGIIWEGVGSGWTNTGTAAWTEAGEPIPFLERATSEESVPAEGLSLHESPLEEASEGELAEVTIPVEDIEAPIHLVSATDDRRWPSTRLSELVFDRFNEADHPYEYTHTVIENAGHFITHPYLPTAGAEMDEAAIYGGSPAANARANTTAWTETLSVLERSLQ